MRGISVAGSMEKNDSVSALVQVALTRSTRSTDERQRLERNKLAKRLTREPLPGDPRRFALLDGPVVLAALAASEPALASAAAITPQYEHQYIAGREWQSGHFLAASRLGTVALKPLYEVADEPYCAYFRAAE